MTSPSPLVSIVTPSLNRAEHLKGLLRSVRGQTYPNIEHIVVDGGSTDETLRVLEKAHADHSFRWLSEPDEGVYDAVNKGLKLCSGDILCYLNTDDRFFDYSVQAVVDAFGTHPDADVVFGDLLAFDEDEGRGWINFYPKRVRDHLRRGGLISQPTAFWRRSAGERTGDFNVGLRLAADIDYWQRMLRHSNAVKVDEVLAYEGHHQERLTAGAEAAAEARTELAAIRSRLHGADLSVADRLIDKVVLASTHRISTVRFLFCSWFRLRRRPVEWSNFRAQSRFRVDRRAMVMSLIPVVGRGPRVRVVTERRPQAQGTT